MKLLMALLNEAEGKSTILREVRIFPWYRVQVFIKHEEGKALLVHEQKFFFKAKADIKFLKFRSEFYLARLLIAMVDEKEKKG